MTFTRFLSLTALLTVFACSAMADEKKSTPATPAVAASVTTEENLQIVIAQLNEALSENAFLKATLARIDTANKLGAEWNKRGCAVERDPQTGLLRCAARPEAVKPEAVKPETKK